MITFKEVGKEEIRESHKAYFHEQGRYFRILRNGEPLCFYGVISRTVDVGEAFLMMKTFNGKVLSKGFFVALFTHAFSLGYKELYTWTKWDRLAKLFRHFKRFGIEETRNPPWDKGSMVDSRSMVDPRWFIKRV